jgi:hypothetical protein
MNTPKNVNVELLKNGNIRMSLVENVTEYPIKEQLKKLPIEQKHLLACYAMLQTVREGVSVIVDTIHFINIKLQNALSDLNQILPNEPDIFGKFHGVNRKETEADPDEDMLELTKGLDDAIREMIIKYIDSKENH